MDGEKYLNFPFEEKIQELNEIYNQTFLIDYEQFKSILGIFHEIFEFTEEMYYDTFTTLDENSEGEITYEKIESIIRTLQKHFLSEIETFKEEMHCIQAESYKSRLSGNFLIHFLKPTPNLFIIFLFRKLTCLNYIREVR